MGEHPSRRYREFSLKVEKKRQIPLKKEAVVKNQMEVLHLDELYDMHKDYIRDILRRQAMYTPERINDLYTHFAHLFRSREELEHVLSGTDTVKGDGGSGPFPSLPMIL